MWLDKVCTLYFFPWIRLNRGDPLTGAFNYDFGALSGRENELGTIFSTMLYVLFCLLRNLRVSLISLPLSLDSRLYPPKTQLLYRAFRRTLPSFIANFLLRFPTKEEKRFLGFLNASKRIARPIFEGASKDDKTTEDSGESKDVLSILVRSNQELDSRKSLDTDEVLSQMAWVSRTPYTALSFLLNVQLFRTIILAGHETTAGTSGWILYALTKNPKDQERVCQEIRELREQIGDNAPSPQDLDSMPFFNAVIKVGLVSSLRDLF